MIANVFLNVEASYCVFESVNVCGGGAENVSVFLRKNVCGDVYCDGNAFSLFFGGARGLFSYVWLEANVCHVSFLGNGKMTFLVFLGKFRSQKAGSFLWKF